MKKVVFSFATALVLVSCGGYTDEQSKAADTFCECMDKEGDFDILWFECENALLQENDPSIVADEGWGLALEEKCPTTAGKIAEQ